MSQVIFTSATTKGEALTGINANFSENYATDATLLAAINAKPSLGETSSTAYRGDRGKTAYDFSQTATTAGAAFVALTNPGAITFPRINANNTVSALDAATFRTAIGAGVGNALTSGTLAQFAATTSAQLAGVISDGTGTGAAVFANSPVLTDPYLGTPAGGNLAYCSGLPATQLSGTGNVGINLLTLSIPSAIRFPRLNADFTVDALSGDDFRAAIGAGTGTSNFDGAYGSLSDKPDLSIASITSGTISGVTLGPIQAPSDILEQRNGANAQEARLYETYTDSGNHTHLKFQSRPGSNDFYITADYSGSGSQRGVTISSALSFNSVTCASSTANTGVVFATAQTTRWVMNHSGHFITQSDNTYAIGDSTHRPKGIELGDDGVVLTSPDSTRYRLTVANGGIPVFTAI